MREPVSPAVMNAVGALGLTLALTSFVYGPLWTSLIAAFYSGSAFTHARYLRKQQKRELPRARITRNRYITREGHHVLVGTPRPLAPRKPDDQGGSQ